MNTTQRMRSPRRIVSTVAALGLGLGIAVASPASFAAPLKEKVDLTHTSVHFNVWHGGFSQVTYLFRTVKVEEFIFDREDVSKSKVKAVVETSSLDSNHYYRDNFTRSDTFLNSKKFPTATFESTKIWKTGDKTGKMEGNLTLAGMTKPVTFDVTYNKGGPHLRGKFAIDGFTVRGTIKRSDFGIKAFIPWVGDEIEIVIQMEAHRPIDK